MIVENAPSFRPGDEVFVRTPAEILATLDARGALRGLPFMPEMVDACGQRFRVARRLEKTCVEGYLNRRFPENDVVFLDTMRCSGDHHDACKRGCMVFWKESWLRRASPGEAPLPIDESERQKLLGRLEVMADATHYFCQSTELPRATESFPGKYKPSMVWVGLREIWVGNRTVLEVAKLLLDGTLMTFRKRRLGPEPRLMAGPHKRTPTASLGFEPGDWVKVKSKEEIIKTLDRNGRNRGLKISDAMTKACGRRYQVREKFSRMINEETGLMQNVGNSVSLEGSECFCAYGFGGCPRGELLYWREIWLEASTDPSKTRGDSG